MQSDNIKKADKVDNYAEWSHLAVSFEVSEYVADTDAREYCT